MCCHLPTDNSKVVQLHTRLSFSAGKLKVRAAAYIYFHSSMLSLARRIIYLARINEGHRFVAKPILKAKLLPNRSFLASLDVGSDAEESDLFDLEN
jgi:hypothetical protein